MAPEVTLYYGTFVDLPRVKAGAKHELSIRQGALWVASSTGRIEGCDWSISSEEELPSLIQRHGWSNVEVVKALEEQNEFFFPGFIDTHIHAPQYPNSGLFGSSTLLGWLETYTFPLESSMSSLSKAGNVYNTVISRTLANGTTFASYFATIHVPATNLLAVLAHKKGQRALIGRVCMDNPDFCPEYYRDEDTASSMRKTEEVIRHIHKLDPAGNLVKPIVTPRFAPTCTAEALSSLGELAARYDPPLHIQTHISENLNEVSLVRELFPSAMTPDYASVYDVHGLLTKRTILAHAVHLSPSEQSLIASREAKISHCPASNSALGSGLAPVRALLDAGITVGLGTDVSGGYSPSILEATRQACLVSRLLRHAVNPASSNEESTALGGPKSESGSEGEIDESGEEKKEKKKKEGWEVLSVEEALYLATRGGAAVVDMAEDLGGFDVGMFWDVQLIRLGRETSPGSDSKDGYNSVVDVFGWESWVEKVHKWVWTGDDRNVSKVWVGGVLVHELDGEDDGKKSAFTFGLGAWTSRDWVNLVVGYVGVAALGLVLGRRLK
ncbi:chlorohydrolase family protein [Aspergillus undulatus]|uniref:chlorohydrolase family protein n=1 Tax=Aspergillus undulatus TaxID=1810928 RepID=UPI003CCDA20D